MMIRRSSGTKVTAPFECIRLADRGPCTRRARRTNSTISHVLLGEADQVASPPGVATETGRPKSTGPGGPPRRCCGRASNGSSAATSAHRGSSRYPGPRGSRCRRRANLKAPGRQTWGVGRDGQVAMGTPRRSGTESRGTRREVPSAGSSPQRLRSGRAGESDDRSRGGGGPPDATRALVAAASDGGHHPGSPKRSLPPAPSRPGHRFGGGGSRTSTLPSSPSPCRGPSAGLVQRGGTGVEHPAQNLPRLVADRPIAAVGLNRRRRYPSLSPHEPVVLPTPSRGCGPDSERVVAQAPSPPPPITPGTGRPLVTATEVPREGEGCGEQAGRLGDRIVVRADDPPTLESGEIELMPPRSAARRSGCSRRNRRPDTQFVQEAGQRPRPREIRRIQHSIPLVQVHAREERVVGPTTTGGGGRLARHRPRCGRSRTPRPAR